MPNKESGNTALVVMDVQLGIIDRIDDREEYLRRIGTAAAGARNAGLMVVHVRVGFRPGYPEVDERNPFFSGVKSAGRMVDGESSEFVPDAAPQGGDVVVVKKRVSAFAGNDLEMILRASRIDRFVLAGLTTGGVVLSTVRAAADLDFQLKVLSDGCNDPDGEVHRTLLEKVFPTQAEVLTVDEWTAGLAL